MRSPLYAAALAALAIPFAAQAQETTKTKARAAESAGSFSTRQALNEHYEQKFADLDKQRITDLAALAPKLKDPEAEVAYSDLFNLAVTRDQYEAAAKAAETFLQGGKGSPQTKALASFIAIIAASNRGKNDEAVKALDAFLKGSVSSDPNAAKADPSLMFAVGEAFLQRLIKTREYDVARKVCTAFIDGSTDPNVKGHFTARLARIEMLGKPAPAISGTDVDGRKVSLADYKGKVILVDFWATWAPPCVEQIPYYTALQSKYGEKGFQVVGVNVDAAHQGVREKDKVGGGVRRFLLAMRVTWPSVMNGTGANDFAKVFGVTDVPANFLLDRDGKIIQVELSGTDLDAAIAKAIAGAKAQDQSEKTSEKSAAK